MKLYKHYKKRFYRLRGYVRHSETLEEMALYDCMYPNKLGQTWVRPRELFHGLHESAPRFAPVELEVEARTTLDESHLYIIEKLSSQIFGETMNIRARLQQKKCFFCFGKVETQIVGFKLGYEISPEVFYSWIGGVHPEWRGLGLASDLMQTQHDWCRREGYKFVQTKSQNRFREMLILNLRRGFHIVATEGEGAELKVWLEKSL